MGQVLFFGMIVLAGIALLAAVLSDVAHASAGGVALGLIICAGTIWYFASGGPGVNTGV